MGFLDRFRSKKKATDTKLREGLFAPFGLTFHDEDFGYRRLSGRNVDRDLDHLTHEKGLKLSYYLYMTNPTARRIIQLTTDFVMGSGMRVVAEHKKVQELIDAFWGLNNMERKLHTRALELGLYGEQLWPVWVGANGMVTMGSIDPLRIHDVVVNQDNAEDVLFAVVQRPDEGGLLQPRKIRIIKKESSGFDEQFGRWKYDQQPVEPGEPNGAFFHRVNSVSNATRGTSDLLPVIDWLDAADQFLWGLLERAALSGMLLWDVTVEDANGQKVQAYADQIKREGGIKPGTVKVHDQSIKWDLRVPSFGSSEYKEAWELIRQQILAGAGIPEHWIFEGGNVNRASAAEMSEPVLRRLRTRQGYFVSTIEQLISFQIQTAIEAGKLQTVGPDDLVFEVVPDRIGGEDQQQQLERVKTATEILTTATGGQLLNVEDGAQIFEQILREAGIEMPTEEPVEGADEFEESDNMPPADLVRGYADVIEMARKRAGGE